MDFNAATEYDAVNNYKVLQAAFTKMGIDKVSYLYPFNARQQPRYLICLGHIVALCIRMFARICLAAWLQIAVNPSGTLRAHGDPVLIACSLESHVLTAAGGCEQAGEGAAAGQHGVHAVAQVLL